MPSTSAKTDTLTRFPTVGRRAWRGHKCLKNCSGIPWDDSPGLILAPATSAGDMTTLCPSNETQPGPELDCSEPTVRRKVYLFHGEERGVGVRRGRLRCRVHAQKGVQPLRAQVLITTAPQAKRRARFLYAAPLGRRQEGGRRDRGRGGEVK